MNPLVSTLIALLGLLILGYRLAPWRKPHKVLPLISEPRVSIIVPCRNEAANLPALFSSLEQLRYTNFEVIIVDDHSTDETYSLAVLAKSRFKSLRVIPAPERPANWGGKNWACASAVPFAAGEYFLFTDADTTHLPESLYEAISFIREQRVGLISAPPFHRCDRLWEKLLGSFLVLPMIAGAYLQEPSERRLFAIGQYLLFTRASYEALGGHAAIRDSLAEDFDLAQLWLRSEEGYAVYPAATIFKVQMYESFKDFVNGWKRLLRLGLKRSDARATVEVALCLNVLGFCIFSRIIWLQLIALAGSGILEMSQRRLGRFSIFGVLMAPLGAWLFCAVSLWAVIESKVGINLKWRGREYKV